MFLRQSDHIVLSGESGDCDCDGGNCSEHVDSFNDGMVLIKGYDYFANTIADMMS